MFTGINNTINSQNTNYSINIILESLLKKVNEYKKYRLFLTANKPEDFTGIYCTKI